MDWAMYVSKDSFSFLTSSSILSREFIHGFLSILFLPLYFILSFFFTLLFLSSLLLLLPPLIYVLKLGVVTDSLQQECMQCLDSQELISLSPKLRNQTNKTNQSRL